MTAECIAKKWFPYSIYMFSLTVFANAFPLAVIYWTKCESIIGNRLPKLPVSLSLIIMSAALVWPFYNMSRENFKTPTFWKRAGEDYIIAIIIFCVVTLIFPALSIIIAIQPLYSCL